MRRACPICKQNPCNYDKVWTELGETITEVPCLECQTRFNSKNRILTATGWGLIIIWFYFIYFVIKHL